MNYQTSTVVLTPAEAQNIELKQEAAALRAQLESERTRTDQLRAALNELHTVAEIHMPNAPEVDAAFAVLVLTGGVG